MNEHRDREPEGVRFMRGVLLGFLLAAPFWCLAALYFFTR